MSRSPSIPAQRTNCVQTTAPATFSRSGGRFLLLRWKTLSCSCGLLLRLANNYSNGKRHHLNVGLRELFSRTAIPDIFWSDRGPQFTSREFKSFADQWGFHHQTSTPHYPQSNGRAEAAVKSMKRIIRAAWNGRCLNEEKLCRALLQYRNTPSRKDGLSPAQKLYGHPIQDVLPAHHSSFAPKWQRSSQEAQQQAEVVLKARVVDN